MFEIALVVGIAVLVTITWLFCRTVFRCKHGNWRSRLEVMRQLKLKEAEFSGGDMERPPYRYHHNTAVLTWKKCHCRRPVLEWFTPRKDESSESV